MSATNVSHELFISSKSWIENPVGLLLLGLVLGKGQRDADQGEDEDDEDGEFHLEFCGRELSELKICL